MTIPTPSVTPSPNVPMNDAEIIASERLNLIEYLRGAGPHASTLCEGWQTRHLIAHLVLRESKPLVAAGVMGGPLGQRTEEKTNEYADKLTRAGAYDTALFEFAKLHGPLHVRTRNPKADCAMNLLEYFVHTEDVRRAEETWQPRELAPEVESKMWQMLTKGARLMGAKKYAGGLTIKAPGRSPVTVIKPKNGSATTITGAPGEIALHLFGREQAVVEIS
ncbi:MULTISPECIES: TIGR03085 family metal-binding protein [unclassified Rothia (in: high G+C Gram-positive bacteria)]|uniref:TIGR03085 family metal-binding protein n=1 Tax=unclassified Rothia (in: high G+C Gram-positive bacteria) TaxID=2689056 RepID=UPI00195E7A49|nr:MULTISPECIES: TIGR03085 family metal-binding protein [unclassified Rothia (in: high G+C Gram-positive bacteria)]MBM7050666.1 TIGR03085 family protein [Rothia sp. ZJ1223]QRZ60855.1 TIGR03085 family protein [Rothia sp. ZJ932]